MVTTHLAQLIDELPGGGIAHPFRAHRGDVKALGNLRLLDQLIKAFLLDKEHRLIAMRRATGLEIKGQKDVIESCRARSPATT